MNVGGFSLSLALTASHATQHMSEGTLTVALSLTQHVLQKMLTQVERATSATSAVS
jgi:hypothetical protein